MTLGDAPTRIVECWGCGASVTLILEERWTADRQDVCPTCGTVIADHARAAEAAANRMTVEEAAEIAARHTWDDVMRYARMATENPGALSPDQLEAVYAFCRLRSGQQHQN